MMANNKSAKKRINLAKRNNLQNRYYKAALNSMVKRLTKMVEQYNENEQNINIDELLLLDKKCQSKIDKAINKNILHKNNGARKKIKLTKLMYNIRSLSFSTNE